MPNERVSILDVIRKGDVSASLFTTFNANLKFYEDLVLRRLTSVGCHQNVLVMDQHQCAFAYASAATRPSLAGIGYTLVPVSVSGAFHPKVCLLAGRKRASLFVGSHNLTISGFGYNREVSSHLDMAGVPGSPERGALEHAWSVVRGWISAEAGRLPIELLESAYALDLAFGTDVSGEAKEHALLLAQQPGAIGLLDQLTTRAPQQVQRIFVMGAFFDHDGRFIKELSRRWPTAQIVVAVEPDTVWMPCVPKVGNLKVVDAGDLGDHGKTGYLHAKALYLEGEGGLGVFASGSANPSAPAWLSTGATVNVEAMLVRVDDAALACAQAIGLDRLASLPGLNERRLVELMDRSKNTLIETEPGVVPVVVGVADHAGQRIILDWAALPFFNQVDALDEADHPLQDARLDWLVAGHMDVSESLIRVRSLFLRAGDDPVARVLVHHPAVIARQIQGSAREPTADLLRELGSELGDISRVLPLLEKVIFSESVTDVLRVPVARSGAQRVGDALSERPETLGVSFAGIQKNRSPSLFAASHDLAYLIDILVNHIEVFESLAARGFDRSGRSEEEQVGQDDNDSLVVVPAPDPARSSDADIGEAVCRRVSKLCRRMVKALGHAEPTTKGTAKSLVQLVAVLALLLELSRLELADRWRIAHIELLSLEDLGSLWDAALHLLFGLGGAIATLIAESAEVPEEVGNLVSLMLWVAWLLNREWWSPSEEGWPPARPRKRRWETLSYSACLRWRVPTRRVGTTPGVTSTEPCYPTHRLFWPQHAGLSAIGSYRSSWLPWANGLQLVNPSRPASR